jgi:hypothetical protein
MHVFSKHPASRPWHPGTLDACDAGADSPHRTHALTRGPPLLFSGAATGLSHPSVCLIQVPLLAGLDADLAEREGHEEADVVEPQVQPEGRVQRWAGREVGQLDADLLGEQAEQRVATERWRRARGRDGPPGKKGLTAPYLRHAPCSLDLGSRPGRSTWVWGASRKAGGTRDMDRQTHLQQDEASSGLRPNEATINEAEKQVGTVTQQPGTENRAKGAVQEAG